MLFFVTQAYRQIDVHTACIALKALNDMSYTYKQALSFFCICMRFALSQMDGTVTDIAATLRPSTVQLLVHEYICSSHVVVMRVKPQSIHSA